MKWREHPYPCLVFNQKEWLELARFTVHVFRVLLGTKMDSFQFFIVCRFIWMCILLLVENPTFSFELSYHCGPNSWIIRRIRTITTAGATTNLNILDWVWPFTPLAINKSLIQTRLVVWKWKIFTSYYWLSRPCHFREMGLGLIFTGKGRCSGIFESWTFNLGAPPLFTIRAPSQELAIRWFSCFMTKTD